jgi:hypothetical protein
MTRATAGVLATGSYVPKTEVTNEEALGSALIRW